MTSYPTEPADRSSGHAHGSDLPSVGDRSHGGTLDDLRRRNLSAVLQVIHLRDGSTRAEITHETRLNRSTVRALVADLVDAGVVTEGAAVRSGGVGRPSPCIRATDAVRVLAVNPEVDATSAALVGLGGRVLARSEVRHRYPPTPAQVVDAVVELLARLAPDGGLRGIGVAVPGLVDSASGTVVMAPHLGWQDVPLARDLTERTSVPVVVDNDANCGVVAESLFGAGRGRGPVVYLNGGASGIGGSVATGGILTAGAHGYGGEFGHTLVNSSGLPCDCGAAGCLETEVTRARVLGALGGVPVAELDLEIDRRSAAGSAATLDAPLASSGTLSAADPAAAEVDRQLRYLGIALRTVVNVMNPERVILGGFLASMVRARGMGPVEAELARALPGARADVQVVTAELGPDILAVGAAQLVLQQVVADPLRSAGAERLG